MESIENNPTTMDQRSGEGNWNAVIPLSEITGIKLYKLKSLKTVVLSMPLLNFPDAKKKYVVNHEEFKFVQKKLLRKKFSTWTKLVFIEDGSIPGVADDVERWISMISDQISVENIYQLTYCTDCGSVCSIGPTLSGCICMCEMYRSCMFNSLCQNCCECKLIALYEPEFLMDHWYFD